MQNTATHFNSYRFHLWILLLLLTTSGLVKSQNPVFIEPEVAIGKVIGNYPDFPSTGVRSGISVSLGMLHYDSLRQWPAWFNFPAAGITVGAHRLGNDAVYGYEFDVIPFIALSPSKSLTNRLWFRIGMGPAFFTRHYFSSGNDVNKSIGSSWNWAFQIHMYKNWMLNDRLSFRAGLGYLHGSNGHTQLPNFGLNSFAAEVGVTVYVNEPVTDRRPVQKPDFSGFKSVSIHARYGMGLQEFGGTIGPIGGPKRPVHCATVGIGWRVKKPWKLKAGLTYRYYSHINQFFFDSEQSDNHWQASNLFFALGTEFTMGHFGIDVELGINIFKPYYRTFFDEFESGDEFQYALKRMFPSRFGVNAYLISNEKNWKNNLYLGAFICANFGEADFSELSLTFAHRIR